MLFDLLIVPALLWKRTRIVALVITTLFHLTNAFVFPIGIFPWLMIAATFVFLPPDFPRSLPGVFRQTTGKADQAVKLTWQSLNTRRRAIAFALLALVLVHTALPFRYLLLPGSPNWTERGHCFAWHMMLRSKYGGVRLYVTDRRTGETGIADLRKHVAFAQMMRVARDPENIRQLAHKVADYYREHGRPDVEVRALSLVSLNGRKPQLMIDPKVDLAAEPRTLATPSWILPLTEPLRKNHWEVPLVQWDQELGIDPESLLGVPLNLSARKVAQREVANSIDDADEEFTR
jgi:vitamin K-dependent gamma-carboxylase